MSKFNIPEKKTVEQLKKYEFIVNSSNEFMTLINKDYIYEVANPAYCNAHQKDSSEIVGKTVSEVWGKEVFLTIIKPRLDRCFRGEELVHPTQFEFGDLGLRYMLVNYTPYYDENGVISHVVVINYDITVVKKAEEKMRKAREEAELLSRAKSEFLNTVSHEILTPINGIVGMTDLLLDSETTESQLDFLTEIKSSTSCLMGIIKDILDFSKIEDDQIRLDNINFDFRNSIVEVLLGQAMHACEKGLKIKTEIDDDVPEIVNGDMRRLSQVLNNLIDNAVKFTDEGSVVFKVSKDFEKKGKIQLKFTVIDTGIGIPDDKFDLLFQSFRQLDGSTTRRFGGTGLGLAISKKIIELMDGRIWCESTLGTGSIFTFTVSLGKVEEKRKVGVADCLLVYQSKYRGMFVKQVLNQWNQSVRIVRTYSEAVQAIKESFENDNPFKMFIFDKKVADSGDNLINDITQRKDIAAKVVLIDNEEENASEDLECKSIGISKFVTRPELRSYIRQRMIIAFNSEFMKDKSIVVPMVVSRVYQEYLEEKSKSEK